MYREKIPRYVCPVELDENSQCYDVVVVGAGIAGLFAALNIASNQKVLLMAKGDLRTCNSNLAQGGIAMTLDGDYESHIADTLSAGSYHNDADVVRQMIQMSPEVYETLIRFNTQFDKVDGVVSMTAEGGHTKRRIIHCKDLTGEGVMTALINELESRENIQCLTDVMGMDVLTDELGYEVIGFNYLSKKDLKCHTVRTPNVILATGGIGGLFDETTNVAVVTGDGLAMALRAGVSSKDAEFIQFHPTAMALKSGGYFLISEAVRGEGGHLINEMGQRFMNDRHEMKELAPRDVVAKAIHDQKLQGHDVFVDVRHFEEGRFSSRFPNIYRVCLENGIDPLKQGIPVTPVEHYFMGGIRADMDGKTTCEGLYVTGEAAGTGFHGANRLASNSLLECLALSKRVVDKIHESKRIVGANLSVSIQMGMNEEELDMLGGKVKALFSEVFTIMRSHQKLNFAERQFQEWRIMMQSCGTQKGVQMNELTRLKWAQMMNALMVGEEICHHAQKRKQSLGGFLLEEE